MIELSPFKSLSLEDFEALVNGSLQLKVSNESQFRLNQARDFIDELIKNNAVVYGLTTGFADLRNKPVNGEKAAELSKNIIESHDAGIGDPLPQEVVIGAMIVRANALAKGFSGFRNESLNTLVQMINARIIPEIPSCGSLGASGDLALLSRLGRAMMGANVPVHYKGKKCSAKEALDAENIIPFSPKAKEGLALTNGTSFMASMGAIALSKEIHLIENILAFMPLFLESVEAIDAAFADPIHAVRGQEGQRWVASLLYQKLENSLLIDKTGTQNDYCIRCIPQILGPKLELLCSITPWIMRELDAVTDNPILFKGDDLKNSIGQNRLLDFNNESWAVLSGGNFHGEYLTTAADAIGLINAKFALLLERQMTYMLNPFRNENKLPAYLISNESNAGLLSGYMITQYTGNDLAQRIAALGNPTGIFNLTSANESEDVVSYGSTAFQRVLQQIKNFEDFLAIYLTIVMQAYSLKRQKYSNQSLTYSEGLFKTLELEMKISHPYFKEDSFEYRYLAAKNVIQSNLARKFLDFPLLNYLKEKNHLSKNPSTEVLF